MKHVPAILILASLTQASPSAAQSASTVPQLNITTAASLALADYATRVAGERGMKICVAIADADGNLTAFTRMQGAYAGCIDASIAKARSAARFSVNTVTFYDLARKDNLAIGTIPGILPAVGGVVLRQTRIVVGSVGISGDTDSTEEKLAQEVAGHFK